jgi:hypothetical protein
MKTILVALAIVSACGADATYAPPDAAQHAADAAIDSPAPDAAPAGIEGCMGNLPTSRTATINTGDPIPPNLINELQDMHAGDRRKMFWRQWFPTCWTSNLGAAPTLVTNPTIGATESALPVWHFAGGSPGAVAFTRIPYEGGDIPQSVVVEVLGDGAVDWVATLNILPSIGGTSSTISQNGIGVVNEPAVWSYDASMITIPTTLPNFGTLSFVMSIVSGAGTALHVGNIFVGSIR